MDANRVKQAYLALDPPRTLTRLAVSLGLTSVPGCWLEWEVSGSWASLAAQRDRLLSDVSEATAWAEINHTRDDALDLCKQAVVFLRTSDPSSKDEQAAIASYLKSIQIVTAIRSAVLTGVVRPESSKGEPLQLSFDLSTSIEHLHGSTSRSTILSGPD